MAVPTASLTIAASAAVIAGYDDVCMYEPHGVTLSPSTRRGRWTFTGPLPEVETILGYIEDRADAMQGFDNTAAERATCRRAIRTATLVIHT